MYLTVDSLIDKNNGIPCSKNITLRKINAKPYGYGKMHMNQDLIEEKLYQLIDQFDGRKINHKKFYFALLYNICPFYDANRINCQILFLFTVRGK